MNVTELLAELSQQGVQLWAEGERLRFRAPKGALKPEQINLITQHKLQILEQVQQSSTFSPLSHSQQGLWYIYESSPESPAYNVAFAARICSNVDVPALRRAFQALSLRHPSLRTTFTVRNGEPVQQVHGHMDVDFEETDASTWNSNELNDQVKAAYQRPFDLERGSVMRVNLFTHSAQEHILLLTAHHIAVDFWSLEILLDQLRLLYTAETTGTTASGLSSSLRYTDYVRASAEMLNGPEGERLWAYWQKQLSGELPVLNLPTDRQRPLVPTYRGSSHSFKLNEELARQIKALAKAEGTTLYTTLLAAFQVLLYRYTNQEDLLVGSPTAGRNQHELAEIVGQLVNPVVLRANLSGNPSFKTFLSQVRRTVLAAMEHQDYPLQLLVKQLHLPREQSHSPLFQVLFVFQKPQRIKELSEFLTLSETKAKMNFGGLELEPFPLAQQEGQFDLTLEIFDTADQTSQALSGILKYNTDLFDAATISRMAEHFQTLLEGIIANPEQHISALPLLTRAERHQLLVEWNQTQVDYSTDKCIHQLIEAQVEQTPNAIAVVFENQQLTYRELNTRANQLAHHLQSLGVRPDVLVGICVERSLEMVIGLLGILKAGGAYVPFDPNYPQERLAFMLEDSQVPVLLTQQRLVASVPKHSAQVVLLDASKENIAQHSQDNPCSGVTNENLAYIIYTSGSTGTPKGAMNTHQGIRNRLLWMQEAYKLTVTDRVLQKTPFSFDVSVWEFFWPLLTGSRLVVARPEGHKDSAYLVKLITEQEITTLHFVPSMLQVFLEEPGLEACRCLKQVMCSGEALPPEVQKRFFARLEAKLHNLYGPTEAAVDVTFWECDRHSQRQIVPIGRPIANTQIYLLDSQEQPVPIGVPGELHIGGIGLARGYLNRPELTAQKFIRNPFSDEPASRLYKTGDLARYLSNGNIEYLGRIDHQVKVRGFRIELGEIETALSQHPAVQETVLLAREDIPGDKRLVAYIVPGSGQTPSISELRSFLKARLPEYMVPSAFVFLDTLPLTPNGKLDRRALPAPDQIRPELEKVFVAPRTPEEELLAGIWAEVLGLERVGIYDNFFDLGGDSIRSIQVRALAQKIGLDFSTQQLFQHQTLHELAREVSKVAPSSLSTPKTEAFSLISEADRLKLCEDIEDAYPLATLQAGMLFHSQYSPDSAMYHDIFSYHLKVPFHQETLLAAIQQLVNRHAVLRTSFDLTNFSESLQLVHKIVDVPLSIEDLRHLSGNEQEEALVAWIEAEKKQHFDWSRPPLLRFQIHRRTEETFQLTLSFHHAILDGWSVASTIAELLQQYFFLLGAEVNPIQPPPAIAFRDFVALEQKALQSSECRQYWLDKLSELTVTTLPRQAESSQGTKTQQHRVQEVPLSPHVSDGLKQLARSAGVPLKSVLMAAHLKVLSLLSNQTDILTGMVSHSRPEAVDAERVLGLFLNTLPFRLQLLGGTWTDLVRATFAAERELLPFRQYPLAELQRVLGGQPLFETAFNFIHFHVYEQVLGLKGIELLGGKFFEETNFTFLANFRLDPLSSQVQLSLNYDSTQLSAEQIARFSGYYARTLEAMATQPSGRYELHTPLSPTERQQLLVEWNNTQADYSLDSCIHELFEAQVERTPDVIAVVIENQQLTYRELNNRANQLAHHLQSLGIGPDVLVGICVERSLEMVVGLLGILKAGGAYVPLDPNYPQERISYMLADSQVSVLLTQQRLLISLPKHNAQVVLLDADWDSIAQHNPENSISQVTVSHLAYIIYTSGSTGKPKGVAIEHRNTVTLLHWAKHVFTPEALSGVLASTSICFDLSVFELFVPLSLGAKAIIAENALHLPTLPAANEVTLINTVPSAIAELLKVKGVPASVHTVNLAGEPLRTPLVADIYELGTVKSVFDLYGPSEDTTYSTFALRSANEPETIGRPIANTQIYLLDSHMQPVPIGVPGELYIGGAGLARGYLNRPELTAQRFIRNPFSDEPNSRLYKTGDLARYLSDGNIEFLGRIDHQVKVRGFRIELGEIETALSQHPAVQETVLLAREDIPGDKRLVAYIVPGSEQTPTISQLRSFLKERLPEYMVPSIFVFLDALPRTPNGKVDRRALPAPDTSRSKTEEAFVAPLTPVEERLAKIWAEVLGVERISIHDNFFDLGGHSLLAVRFMAQIQTQFGQNLPLSTLFQNPTVQRLARVLTQPTSSSRWSPLVEINPRGSKRPIFCMPGAGANVIYLHDFSRYLGSDQPLYAMQARGLDGVQTPHTRIEDVAAEYIEAMQTVQPQGPYLLVGHSFGGYVAFEMAQQLNKQGHEVALLAILGISAPLPDNYPLIVPDDVEDDAELLTTIAKRLFEARLTDENPSSVSYDELKQLDPEEQLDYWLAKTKVFNLLDPNANRLIASGLLQVRKANLKAILRYTPTEVYPHRITLFRGTDEAAEEASIQNAQIVQDPSFGWNHFSNEPVEVNWVPGGHVSMMAQPNVQILAERLKQRLNSLSIASVH